MKRKTRTKEEQRQAKTATAFADARAKTSKRSETLAPFGTVLKLVEQAYGFGRAQEETPCAEISEGGARKILPRLGLDGSDPPLLDYNGGLVHTKQHRAREMHHPHLERSLLGLANNVSSGLEDGYLGGNSGR